VPQSPPPDDYVVVDVPRSPRGSVLGKLQIAVDGLLSSPLETFARANLGLVAGTSSSSERSEGSILAPSPDD
jgi:hypothetical protein